MPSKLRAPTQSGEMGKVVQKIYDDINSLIDSLNLDLEGAKEPDEKSKSGSVCVVKEGNKYSLRGKTEDGWASVGIKLLNSPEVSKLDISKKFNNADDIISLTDGSTGTVSDTLVEITGSYVQATMENTVASLAGKVNELVTMVNTHNDRINTLIDKVNEL